MTKARIQQFCRANNINIVSFDGIRVSPRSVIDRKKALFLYNNHFGLIWKSESISFNHAQIEEKDDFKLVDSYITEEIVTSRFKYIYRPKKIESHLTNFVVYDLETKKN